MRVLIVLFSGYPGGSAPANHAQRTALALKSAGAEVTVVGYSSDRNRESLRGTDARGVRYELFQLPRQRLPGYLGLNNAYRRGLIPRLEELFEQEEYNVVLYHGRSWLVARPLWALAKRHGVAVVPFQMEWHDASVSRVLNGSFPDQALFRQWSLPRADGLVGISSFWKAWGEQHGLPTVVIPAFADIQPDTPPPDPARGSGPFKIVFVGRWHPRECFDTTFQGLQRAIDRGVDLQFIIVGRVGPARAEKALLTRLERFPDLKRRTMLTGWVSDEELNAHFRSAGAFVLIRNDDREIRALFPTRLPEYLLTANPVILSAAGDLTLYLRHGESAWVIPSGHAPDALADAVVQLASNEDDRRRIGLGGWRVAGDALSVETLGPKLRDFLSCVISKAATLQDQL